MIDTEGGQQKGYAQAQGINQKQNNPLVNILQSAGVSQNYPQYRADTRCPAQGKGRTNDQGPGMAEFPGFNIKSGFSIKKLGSNKPDLVKAEEDYDNSPNFGH